MTTPILTITDGKKYLRFALQGPISDGYSNELKANHDEHLTHPASYLWEKGTIDDLELELTLAVGVSLDINAPIDLVHCVESLVSMSLANVADKRLPKVALLIGGWYKRFGYIKSVKIKFDAPWEVDTGMPMIATVNLTHTVDFSNRTSGAEDLSTLPKAPWMFNTSEGTN